MLLSLRHKTSRQLHAIRLNLKAWWLYKVHVLVSKDIEPTVFWLGVISLTWGIVVVVAPHASTHSLEADEFLKTFFPDSNGYFGILSGILLLSRMTKNGITWMVVMFMQIGWLWAFLVFTVTQGVSATTFLYATLILRCWWIIYRVIPHGGSHT